MLVLSAKTHLKFNQNLMSIFILLNSNQLRLLLTKKFLQNSKIENRILPDFNRSLITSKTKIENEKELIFTNMTKQKIEDSKKRKQKKT